jgi:glutathione reductase (NADPH)
MFDLDPFPRRLVVVGGGYIACEFASIFNGLGSRVTQLYRGEQVLRGFDNDVRQFLGREMQKSGVDLRLHSDVASVTKRTGCLELTLASGESLQTDTILYATGRIPNVNGLGLAAARIAHRRDGSIEVDSHYRTSVSSVFAVGDVTARVQLTPVALGEGKVVASRLFGPSARAMSYDYIPTAVFTHPNVGTVGLSELQARHEYGEIKVYRSEFKALKHTLSGSQERTLMKLVVDRASDRVVGLHMVGPDAGEIVQGFAVAIKAGATKALFDQTVGIHPTAAEEFVTMRDPVPG